MHVLGITECVNLTVEACYFHGTTSCDETEKLI